MSFIEKAIEILRKTHDGDDLSRPDLGLVQAAASTRGLSEVGEVAFMDLYRRVSDGYQKPNLFGIEHLSEDHEGYIYWRGIQVEHYSHRDMDEKRTDALALAQRCLMLEQKGFLVRGRTVIDPCMHEAPADTPWLNVLLNLYTVMEQGGRYAIILYPDESLELKVREHQVVVVEREADGSQVIRYKAEAWEAYRWLYNQGYRSAHTNKTYDGFVQAMQRGCFAPEEIKLITSGPLGRSVFDN